MHRRIRLGCLLGVGLLIAAAANAAGEAVQRYQANYDIRFESAGERQDLRGTAALAATADHTLSSSDWSATLRLMPIDCDRYRLELEAVRNGTDTRQRDLLPRLSVAGTGRYGAPLTLSAERAGLAVDAAFAVRRHPGTEC